MSLDNNAKIRSINEVSRQALSASKVFFKRLIACKPMGIIQTEIDTQNQLRCTLNWFQLTAIGLGNIIGKSD